MVAEEAAPTRAPRWRRPLGRLGPLVVSRVADQFSIGVASLWLAAVLGPEAFAPVSVLLIVNALSVSISDLGLGFVIMSLPGDERIAAGSLRRVRTINGAVCAATVAAGLIVRGEVGFIVALCGPIWFATAEAYIRKSAALKLNRIDQVFRAEVLGAVAMLAVTAVIVVSGVSGAWIAVALLAKGAVEAGSVRGYRAILHEGPASFRPGPEWVGQIMTYLVANTDYFVIAVLLGPVDLSLYVIAYQTTAAVPVLTAKAFMQMTFLDSSAATSPEARQRAYGSHVRRALALGIAGGLVVAVVAPVMPFVLGSDWEPVVPLMVLLAVAVPTRMLLGINVALAITAGGARAVVRWEAGRLVATAVVVATAAAIGGLVPATAAVAAVSSAAITVEHLLACRVAGVRPDRLVVPWTITAVLLAIGLAVALS